MTATRILRLTALAVVIFMASIGIGRAVAVQARTDVQQRPEIPVAEGVETVLVLVVSPDCAASQSEALVDYWQQLVHAYEARWAETGRRGSLMGVAVSGRPVSGLELLERFGGFDEVVAGRRWQNVGSRTYIESELRGPAVVPQVIVVERNYDRHADGMVRLGEERVVQRRYGLESIRTWAQQSHR